MNNRVFTLLPLLMLAAVVFSSTLRADAFALVHCKLFNGVENGIIENAKVLVSGRSIERVATKDAAIPGGYDTIDCEVNDLMPGLFDVHTHLDNPAAMRRALDSGVTTVRSACVPVFQDVGLREMVRACALPGPSGMRIGWT